MKTKFFVIAVVAGILCTNFQLSYSAQQSDKAQKQAEAEKLSSEVISLYQNGKFDAALPLATRVLQLSEEAFGPNDVAVASAATNLAEIYASKGSLKEAEPLLLKAIAINEVARKPDDPIVTKTLERYACLEITRGRESELKEFEIQRLPALETSTIADRFWGSAFVATKVIRLPKPDYSTAARLNRAAGKVVVEITIDESGKVIKAESICGGHPLLIKSAEDSARGAQIEPVVVLGRPIRVISYLLYRFVAL
ncbi:MAG TPA: tetratricopeptide repeat protein [Pyrinomonadaceae bacterium]|nr:tetratricopeptide repeat protein [Pyrinomonadaceae bacterium]